MYTYYRNFKIEAYSAGNKVIYRVKLAYCPIIFWEQVTKGSLCIVVFEIKKKIDKILDDE